MEAVVIITALALMQFVFFGIQVGRTRGKAGIKAPVMTGTPELDRMFRIHMNTMEQMVLFVPTLWLYAHYVNPLWGPGFTMTFLPSAVMLIWVVIVAIKSFFLVASRYIAEIWRCSNVVCRSIL